MNRVDPKHGFATLTPEQPDDLWTLRRIISRGDLVRSDTSRVLKDTNEFSRPDKQRVKVTVTVQVEQAKLDSTLSRLRVSGKIVDVSNDLLGKGSFHSLSISEGHRLGLKKPDGFSSVELSLVENSNAPRENFAVVAMDTREAGVGLVKGTHLQILPVVESGVTGKMYEQSKKSSTTNYYQKVADLLTSSNLGPETRVFVLGPGTVKNAFANYFSQNVKQLGQVGALEGSDVAGEDGVYLALRNPNLQQALGESRLSKASKVLQETMRRISLNDRRVALAFKDNLEVAKAGAVEALLVSDRVFSQMDIDEDSVVELLNNVEASGGETFLFDSSTDLGGQVTVLGGVVGLLRFAPYT